MTTQPSYRHPLTLIPMVAFALCLCVQAGALWAAENGEIVLFNGRDLSGWHLRSNKDDTSNTWKVVSDVKLDANDPKTLAGSGAGNGSGAVLFRAPIAHGSDIISDKVFGDCELHIEFMVPKQSNSGVYLMGNYEVQVLDSHGKPDNQLSTGDCGGIYSAKAPSTNATKAPGEWQAFDITFRAPRFGPDGKKTENARFVLVKLNGKTIHQNVEVKGGTGGQLSDDKPTGPLMLQGDHGIVAYRDIRIKPVKLD